MPSLRKATLPPPSRTRKPRRDHARMYGAPCDAESRRSSPNRAGSNAATNEEKKPPAPDPDKEPKDDRFYHVWDKFTKKPPAPIRSKIQTLDEDIEGKHRRVGRNREGLASRENAATSFAEAAETCRQKVRAIVAECKRLNKKYTDPMFDLRSPHSLVSLTGWVNDDPHFIGANKRLDAVAEVKRVADIFEKPQFFVDGASANDVRQSRYAGDCWFLASVTALLGMPRTLERLCVERDEQVGVYGFCFHRDGEWISTVIDDRLCLRFYEDQRHCLLSWNPDDTELRSSLPEDFTKNLYKGKDALYFASCKGDNDETWLPLLEKAYAKAHLSYQSIEGGFAGEGVEDLTGGVNTSIRAEDILDKDKLWLELEQVNQNFLFGCGSRRALYEDQEDYETKGVATSHAYTVLEARTIKHKVGKDKEEKTIRLLKVRNPWGFGEWQGAWSDGAKEWTASTLQELDHTFGDDGIFWISLDDFLKAYPRVDRTRLFGPEWTVSQQWISTTVPRTINYSDTEYLPTAFHVEITKAGPVSFLLSQPDDRYFEALSGRYSFDLHFKVYKDGEEDYLIRSMSETASGRSVSAELDCEPGIYTVRIKLTPYRYDDGKTAAEIIKDFDKYGIDKVLQVGKMFDLAHSRGRLREMELAEIKRIKHDARGKRHTEMRAVRDLRRAERRRCRIQKHRLVRKEREKKEARKKAKQERVANANSRDIDVVTKNEDTVDGSSPSPSAKHVVERSEEPPLEGKTIVTEPQGVTSQEYDAAGAVQPDYQENGTTLELTVRIKDPKDEQVEEISKSEVDEARADADRATHQSDRSERPGESTNDAEAPGASADAAANDQQTTQGQAEEAQPEQADMSCSPPVEQDDDGEWTENISDFGSVQDDDFSWDSDVDGSVDEEDFDVNSDSDDEDIYGKDDWFALVTVGLRIYSQDPNTSIKVEHIEEEDEALSRATTM